VQAPDHPKIARRRWRGADHVLGQRDQEVQHPGLGLEGAQVSGQALAQTAVQQLLNDQRNRRLRAVLRATVGLLNRPGIAPVLLKSAIPLLPEQYPLAFARMLGDLDLAVAPRCESA
jgi:hypothetical protein